jgi:uncharacterized membrane protein
MGTPLAWRRRIAGVVDRQPGQQRSRAIVKTAGYRLFMIALTVLVAFAVTSDTTQALEIGLIANLAKTGTYYGYERLWDRIAWGRSAVGS